MMNKMQIYRLRISEGNNCDWTYFKTSKNRIFYTGISNLVAANTQVRAGRSGDRFPVGARFSAPVQTGAQPGSWTMGTGSFSGVKSGRGVLLTTHPLLATSSWKSRDTPPSTFWGTTGPATGLLYLFFLPFIYRLLLSHSVYRYATLRW
jgi:hypothetical protein